MDTIFALSSGRPPAAIAVVRISGGEAMAALRHLAGALPPPRRASVRVLRDATGMVLDRALVIVFPGPETATGEDLVELHLHGGRAVVSAVERALMALPSLRAATAGEFTRRALENGRVDVAQAQGLADLLEAETEGARRAAIAASEGAVGRVVHGWLNRLSTIAAQIEAAIDYSDEGDVGEADGRELRRALRGLAADMRSVLERPSVERLRDGALVVLAGPPNAGKSSLFNALLTRDASIVTDVAGTTRDLIEAAVIRDGEAYRLVDTAGLIDQTADFVERIGIERARQIAAAADLLLWLGAPEERPSQALQLHARSDVRPAGEGLAVSIHDPRSIAALWEVIADATRHRMPADEVRLHEQQRRMTLDAVDDIGAATTAQDFLIGAELVRRASGALASIVGVDATETMLDALFARFCVGK